MIYRQPYDPMLGVVSQRFIGPSISTPPRTREPAERVELGRSMGQEVDPGDVAIGVAGGIIGTIAVAALSGIVFGIFFGLGTAVAPIHTTK